MAYFAGIVSGHPDLPGESVTVRSEVEGEQVAAPYGSRHTRDEQLRDYGL